MSEFGARIRAWSGGLDSEGQTAVWQVPGRGVIVRPGPHSLKPRTDGRGNRRRLKSYQCFVRAGGTILLAEVRALGLAPAGEFWQQESRLAAGVQSPDAQHLPESSALVNQRTITVQGIQEERLASATNSASDLPEEHALRFASLSGYVSRKPSSSDLRALAA